MTAPRAPPRQLRAKCSWIWVRTTPALLWEKRAARALKAQGREEIRAQKPCCEQGFRLCRSQVSLPCRRQSSCCRVASIPTATLPRSLRAAQRQARRVSSHWLHQERGKAASRAKTDVSNNHTLHRAASPPHAARCLPRRLRALPAHPKRARATPDVGYHGLGPLKGGS